jgi:predicted DNA-binding protein with PD1-like motif
MQWTLIDSPAATGPSATYVVVLDQGDEAFECLSQFAKEHDVTAAQLTSIGAFERAVVGWFDRATKEYRRIDIDEQCEVLSLVGDIADSDTGPQLHVHAVLGLSDGSTRGGHLLEGHVRPTLEVIVRESPAELRKVNRPEIGLALIDIAASE